MAGMLAGVFPELEIDDIDVLAEIRSVRRRAATAALVGAVEHARPLATRRISPKRAMVGSSRFGSLVQDLVGRRVTAATHRFTFQSQSLFPASVPGVPHFVYTDHAHLANLAYPGFDRSTLRPTRFLRMEADLYHSATLVFARSTHVRDVIVHGYGCPADRVVVVGVGPNVTPPDDDRDRPWHGGRIVFVGVDWERKGGADLVAAFARVRAVHPQARLDIVGCTPPGVGGDGIVVHGRLQLDEVAAVLAEADVFCLPTWSEPFGVAFIEAMHAGLPVVGTDLAAVPDFARPGETGALVSPGDVSGLAEQLTAMLGDPDATRRMGRAARELARRTYSWDVVMASIRDQIERALTTEARPA